MEMKKARPDRVKFVIFNDEVYLHTNVETIDWLYKNFGITSDKAKDFTMGSIFVTRNNTIEVNTYNFYDSINLSNKNMKELALAAGLLFGEEKDVDVCIEKTSGNREMYSFDYKDDTPTGYEVASFVSINDMLKYDELMCKLLRNVIDDSEDFIKITFVKELNNARNEIAKLLDYKSFKNESINIKLLARAKYYRKIAN